MMASQCQTKSRTERVTIYRSDNGNAWAFERTKEASKVLRSLEYLRRVGRVVIKIEVAAENKIRFRRRDDDTPQ